MVQMMVGLVVVVVVAVAIPLLFEVMHGLLVVFRHAERYFCLLVLYFEWDNSHCRHRTLPGRNRNASPLPWASRATATVFIKDGST